MSMPPDYRGAGIVNLTASLVTALGGEETLYPPVSFIDGESLRGAQNVVLVVIDGLGYEYLVRHGEGGALHRHLAGVLTSVFPTTTATAITTFLTGTAPQQHGITGWFMYLEEIHAVSAVLPFTLRGGKSLRAAGIDAAGLFDCRPLFDRVPVPSYIVIPQHIAYSDYNLAHRGAATVIPYHSMSLFINAIESAVKGRNGRKFLYAYWPELDGLAHEYGLNSRQVTTHFCQLEDAITRLLNLLKGTRTIVIITADHGMIDSGPDRVIEVADHPPVARSLRLPLCGERRAAFCYVHPERENQFVDYVETALRDYASLIESKALIARGYFGSGPPHPRLSQRVGDYTLIMKDNYVIKDWVPGESRHVHVGVHGGLTNDELCVPVIVADSG